MCVGFRPRGIAVDPDDMITVVGTYYGEFDGDLFVRHYAP